MVRVRRKKRSKTEISLPQSTFKRRKHSKSQ